MFAFVVKYLGFLKSLPLLPHFFDSLLKLRSLISKPRLLDWLDEIESEVLSWKGTSSSLHKYGGQQFNFQGREIGHLHSNGLLDIRYSKKLKAERMTEGRISPHHVFPQSGWISFFIKTADDKNYALSLLRAACQHRGAARL